jgi:hypothetical protein
MWFDAIKNAIGEVLGIINKVVPSAEERQKINELMLELQSQIVTAQMTSVVAEEKGESWLQRNWRPLLMMVFGAIIVNNYIIAPFLHLIFKAYPVLPVPDQMWTLLTVGISGYIVGRSGEKIAKELKK